MLLGAPVGTISSGRRAGHFRIELLNQLAQRSDCARCWVYLGVSFNRTGVLVCAEEINVAGDFSGMEIDCVDCSPRPRRLLDCICVGGCIRPCIGMLQGAPRGSSWMFGGKYVGQFRLSRAIELAPDCLVDLPFVELVTCCQPGDTETIENAWKSCFPS